MMTSATRALLQLKTNFLRTHLFMHKCYIHLVFNIYMFHSYINVQMMTSATRALLE
jgi:hypothetical protein